MNDAELCNLLFKAGSTANNSVHCDDTLLHGSRLATSHFVGSLRTIFSGESFGSTPAAAAMSGDLTPPEVDDPGALLDGDGGTFDLS